jgi:hypothetical protein
MTRPKKIKTPKKNVQSTMKKFLPKDPKPVVSSAKSTEKPLGQVDEKMQEQVPETVKNLAEKIDMQEIYENAFAQDLNFEPMDCGDNVVSGINEVDDEIVAPIASDKKAATSKKSNRDEEMIISVLPAKLIWLNDGNRDRIVSIKHFRI